MINYTPIVCLVYAFEIKAMRNTEIKGFLLLCWISLDKDIFLPFPDEKSSYDLNERIENLRWNRTLAKRLKRSVWRHVAQNFYHGDSVLFCARANFLHKLAYFIDFFHCNSENIYGTSDAKSGEKVCRQLPKLKKAHRTTS